MLALVYDGSLRLDPRRPEPDPGDGDALIRVRQAGIAAIDTAIAQGEAAFRGVLGHEFVGFVEKAPDRKLVGRRVVGETSVVCGRCDMCMRGLAAHCRARRALGEHGHDGCFAERLRLPAGNLHVLPDSIDDDAAVFVEPLASAFQVAKQLGPQLDERTWVTVIGSGRLGLLMAQVLRNAGCPVRVVGRNERTLGLCEKWQIRTRRAGQVEARRDQDVVVECTGTGEGVALAVGLCRPRGTIVLKGRLPAQGGVEMSVLSSAVAGELTLLGSRCGPFRPAIQALAERTVDVAPLVERRMKLSNGVEAMEVASRRGALKVLLSLE